MLTLFLYNYIIIPFFTSIHPWHNFRFLFFILSLQITLTDLNLLYYKFILNKLMLINATNKFKKNKNI